MVTGDAILAAFDSSDEAERSRQNAKMPERTTLRTQAVAVVAGNNDFLDLSPPTNAQILAQVKALTRQNTILIKRLVQLSEGA